MPSLTSNAVGTARQFTPLPDATYQGNYQGISNNEAYVPPSNKAAMLANNMDRLSSALQGYLVQHEKYKDTIGLQDATAMINQASPAAIEKLNAIDAAQMEGFADSASNPYFKAYAEKLRGQFLSNRMRDDFELQLQENPDWKKTPDELMRRYSNFANSWKNDRVGSNIAPKDEYAFNLGYNENNLHEATGLIDKWYDNRKQENLTLTVSQVSNDLDKTLMNMPNLVDDPKKVQEAIQTALNPTRLMGIPLESRMKIIQDFLHKGIVSGSMPINIIDKVLPNIVMQTTSDGKTIKLSDCMDMKGLHVDAVNYLSRYNSTLKETFINNHVNDYQGALNELEAIQYSDPDRYQLLATTLPIIKAQQERIKAQAEAEARKAARGGGVGGHASAYSRAYRGSRSTRPRRYSTRRNPDGTVGAYGGHRIKTAEGAKELIDAATNGVNTVNGLPISSYTVTPELYFPAFSNQCAYLAGLASSGTAGQREWAQDGLYNLMNSPQGAPLRKSLAYSYQAALSTIHIGDDGHAELTQEQQNLISFYATNPLFVKDTMGEGCYKDAIVMHTLYRAHPEDTDAVADAFYEWKNMEPEKKKMLVAQVKPQIAGYTAEGVENLDPSQGSSTVNLGENPDFADALLLGSACAYNLTGDTTSAINQVGSDIAQGYFQYRGAMIPKYTLKGIGTSDDRQNLLDSLCMEMTLEDGTIPDSCRIKYDATTRTFTFYDPDHAHLVGGVWTNQWTRSEDYVISGAQEMPAYRAEYAAKHQQDVAEEEAERERQQAEYRAYLASKSTEIMDNVTSGGDINDAMATAQEVADAVNPNIPNTYADEDYTGEDYMPTYHYSSVRQDDPTDYENMQNEGQ